MTNKTDLENAIDGSLESEINNHEEDEQRPEIIIRNEKDLIELIEAVKENKISLHSVSVEANFDSPLPPAEFIERYNIIEKDGGSKILNTLLGQIAHNNKLEAQHLEKESLLWDKVIKNDLIESVLGTISGFLVCVFTIGVGGYLIINGHDISGTILGGAGLGSIVTTFVIGRSGKTKNNKKQ